MRNKLRPYRLEVSIDRSKLIESLAVTYEHLSGEESLGNITQEYFYLSEGTHGFREFVSDGKANPLQQKPEPILIDSGDTYKTLAEVIKIKPYAVAVKIDNNSVEFKGQTANLGFDLIENTILQAIKLDKNEKGLPENLIVEGSSIKSVLRNRRELISALR